MSNEQTATELAASVAPLPPVPKGDVFTSTQWDTLMSICEVFVPELPQITNDESRAYRHIKSLLPKDAALELMPLYFSESSCNSEFKNAVHRRFAVHVPKAQVKALAFVLSALNTTLGSLVLTGSNKMLQDQLLPVRSQIVCGWANSYLPPLRSVFRSFENLTKATWLAQSKTLRQIIDFPNIPSDIERNETYPYKFLDFDSGSAEQTVHLSADVVIVGSGCGAGVVAAELSTSLSKLKKSPRILVLEKGYHFPSKYFPMDQPAAGVNLFEAGGGVLTDDGTIAFLAGSTFGGGGTVNWSASLQPQSFVREEWESKHNLPFFTSAEFQECLDEVCDKMGVCRMHDELSKHKIPHSYGNRMLLEGARRLGLSAEVVPQNTAGKPHDCGRCGLGCPSTIKQGPVNCWFPRAARNGVEFIQGCFAQEILWETTSSYGKKNAVGLKATWTAPFQSTTRTLRISCPRVIISAGTLHSPLLLHRSGLTPSVNRHIGSHLHLHPTFCVGAAFAERINPWEGPILTSAVTSLENLDGQGHGPKIEVMFGTPDFFATWHPWRPQLTLNALKEAHARKSSEETLTSASFASALDFKLRMAQFAHSFGLIAIQRDIETGYVYGDVDDPSIVRTSYTTSSRDKECLLTGALTAAKIAYTMGAETIDLFTGDVMPFTRSPTATQDINDAAFRIWYNEIQARGAKVLNSATLGSAHQMGTCRMSARHEDGVVDASGKVWGTENVWIADASVFPSASGVNPMVTVMAISLKIARGIVEAWTTQQ